VSGRLQAIGRWGENVAAGYLERHGYEILDRNARTPYGEIDLIAKRGEIVSFVEVKTRTNRAFGLPEVSVTPRKQSHMLAAAEHYSAEREIDSWQLDVIAIERRSGDEAEIVHFENILGN
jgi:putative endonuclease